MIVEPRRTARLGAYDQDATGFKEWVSRTFGVDIAGSSSEKAIDPDAPDIGPVMREIDERYVERRDDWGPELTSRIESYLVLTAIDQKWKDHLHAMDALKAGIGLRGYGQQDPKIAYKKEATELFNDHLLPAIETDVATKILRIEVNKPEEQPRSGEAGSAGGSAGGGDGLAPRGIASEARAGAPAAGAAPQRKVRFDELNLDQQKAVVAQLPEEQKLVAVMQAGDNEPDLLAELDEDLREKYEEFKAQIIERQKAAEAQRRAQAEMARGPAASNAFDVMRRRKLMEEQRQRAAEAQEAQANDGPSAEPTSSSGTGSAAKASQPKPGPSPKPAASAKGATASSLGPEFKDVGRNDTCPCGSGKKFKKCHGR